MAHRGGILRTVGIVPEVPEVGELVAIGIIGRGREGDRTSG